MEIICKFKDTTIVLLRNDHKLVDLAEYFKALVRFREKHVDFTNLNSNAFQKLRQRVINNTPIPFDKDILIKILYIVSFLNISEENLRPLLPKTQISSTNIESFLPFIHRLLVFQYTSIAKEWAIQARLPLDLLKDQNISYSKFKVKALAKCRCDKCTKFRHDLIWYDPEAPFSEDKYVPFFN